MTRVKFTFKFTLTFMSALLLEIITFMVGSCNLVCYSPDLNLPTVLELELVGEGYLCTLNTCLTSFFFFIILHHNLLCDHLIQRLKDVFYAKKKTHETTKQKKTKKKKIRKCCHIISVLGYDNLQCDD